MSFNTIAVNGTADKEPKHRKPFFIRFGRKFFVSAVAVSLCVSPAFAAESAYGLVGVENHASLGGIDIDFVKEDLSSEAVVPGQLVKCNGSIINKAESAWIRVKVEYVVTDKANSTHDEEISDKHLVLSSDSWKKIGDYYYYTEPVDAGATIDFIDGIKIPSNWDSSTSGMSFNTLFTAQAVQTAHFTPDFSAIDPWHGTVIESFDTDNYQLKTEGNEFFQIICDSTSENLIAVGEDFFSNWKHIMPGDTLTGRLVISNHMTVPVNVYFSSESRCKNTELLSRIHIRLTNGTQEVFDGTMDKLIKEKLLRTYDPDDSTIFAYQVDVPEDLNNAYALNELKTVWIFRADTGSKSPIDSIIDKITDKDDPDDDPDKDSDKDKENTPDSNGGNTSGTNLSNTNGSHSSGGSSSGGSSSSGGGVSGSNSSSGGSKIGSVHTGDDTNLLPFYISGIISGGILIVLAIIERFKHKRKRRNGGGK